GTIRRSADVTGTTATGKLTLHEWRTLASAFTGRPDPAAHQLAAADRSLCQPRSAVRSGPGRLPGRAGAVGAAADRAGHRAGQPAGGNAGLPAGPDVAGAAGARGRRP